jgi:hypothetical protein
MGMCWKQRRREESNEFLQLGFVRKIKECIYLLRFGELVGELLGRSVEILVVRKFLEHSYQKEKLEQPVKQLVDRQVFRE